MPIRHGGIAATRASIWPRDHFLPQDDRAALVEPDHVERILADIDAHGGNGRD